MCNRDCKICDEIIISDAVTIVTLNGIDTLVIDIPNGRYIDRCRYCVVVAQTIPDTATINMPVAFSIGGVTTTVYPFINCNCTQVTACGVRNRTRYPVVVFTTPAGGVFRSTRELYCYPADNLPSLPVT